MKKKTLSISTFVILAIALMVYINVFAPSVKIKGESVAIYVPTGSDNQDLDSILRPVLRHTFFLRPMINYLTHNVYPVRAGKFTLNNGQSNLCVLRAVFAGAEDQVKLTFNNQKDITGLVSVVARQIEADSLSMINIITDAAFLDSVGMNRQTIRALFIPNTYYVHWDTSAEEFVERMQREYDKFWDNTRLDKAKKLGLSPIQVSTLAAIVQWETPKADEQPLVAGLYLNRLKYGIPLQSDPTVIYAKREFGNVSEPIRRVYLNDLKIDSPYNTYKHKGLPPAPILIPESQAVDAVLDYSKHDYLYMCASVSRFGYHEFANDLKVHSVNRAKYIKWLNERNIK